MQRICRSFEAGLYFLCDLLQIPAHGPIPAYSSWSKHKESVYAVLSGSCLDLLGDGRCNRPGYSTKYCIYGVMNSVGLFVDYEVVHVSQTNDNSSAMEKLGLKTVLDRLQKKQV